MINGIIRYILGFLRIKICGENKSRLINIATKNKIGFWDYKKREDCYILCLSISDFKRLCKLRRRYKVTIDILEKKGLIFFLAKLRIGIVMGLIGSVFLYIFLFSHYWSVDVSGNDYFPKEKILEIAKREGVFVGSHKDEKNLYVLENIIMKEVPELSWISINNFGCKIDIAVKIKIEKPNTKIEQDVQDMIAEKPGRIVGIEATEGMPEVSIGSVVNQGDVLITGRWDSNRGKNEWELTENPVEFSVCAKGKVMAEVPRIFTATIPKTKTIYEPISSYKKYDFGILFFELHFTFSLVPQGKYEYNEEIDDLYLLGKKLPVYMKKQELIRLEEKEKTLTKEEAEKELSRIISINIAKELDLDEKVLEKINFEINETNYSYTARLECVTLENIAIPYKITTNEQ